MEASAIRSLPLGATDGFVLSRIDGKASEKELAGFTGLPDSQIRASLDKLLALKVITFDPLPPAPSKAHIEPSKPSLPGGSASADSSPQLNAEKPPQLPAAPVSNALLDEAMAKIPLDSAELAEEVDIPLELRRRILALHSVLGALDHYAILGLPRTVDKKGVKRAYFEMAALFHPDRYFRKNIGSFKGKMEVVFAKVSVAYETLADKAQRAEYDLYLGDVEKSREVEAMLRNVMAEAEAAEQVVMAAAQSGTSLPSSAFDSQGALRAADAVQPAATPAAAAPPQRSAIADQMRREALAMRLRGNRPITKPPIEVKPLVPPPPRSNPAEAVDALKRRYEDRVEAGRRQQADKYVKIGESAESRNDLTAAAAAFRVALTFLRPEDAAHPHALEVIAKSEASLGETYMRQADHEEKASRWEDACRSWGRAAKLRPTDHRVLERYAHALLKTNGDLHEAVQCAQKAIAMAPTVPEYRATLANIFLAAGLHLNAKRELESAALQFPESHTIAALLKKLQKPT